MNTRKKILLLFAFVSGFAALMYEVIWLRKMHLVFGVNAYASATVFSTFLLGLVLGSYLGGLFADRYFSLRKIARLYSVIELLIAISALLVPVGILLTKPTLAYFYRFSLGFGFFNFVRFLLSTIILIMPTTFIGATFPILFRLYTEKKDEIKEGISLLYFVNTLGGVIGVLASGFFLIRLFGMDITLGVAVIGNIIVSVSAFQLSKKCTENIEKEKDNLSIQDFSQEKSLLIFFFASGFSALAYEVIWGRLLVLYSFGTIYATSTLLMVILLGIALGSWFYSHFFVRADLRSFAYLELLIAVFAVTGMLLFSNLGKSDLAAGARTPLYGLLLFALVLALFPSFLFGVIFPLISEYVLRHSKHLGGRTGVLYSLNTLGAVVGAVVAGFLLTPVLGLKGSLVGVSLLSLMLGMAALLYRGEIKRKDWLSIIFILLMITFIMRIVPPQFSLGEFHENVEVVSYDHGQSATVSVLRDQQQEKTFYRLYVDNQEVAATTPALTLDSKMLAHLPLLLHENPRTALTVGFGSGGTSYSMLLHDLERVDVVEIESKIIDAREHFRELNHNVEHDKRLRIIIDDARAYVTLTDKKYDIISTDLTNVRYYSNSNLYTKEYFELLKSQLNLGGIVSVWAPASGISEKEQKILMRTFQDVFPHASVWYFYHKLTHFYVFIGSENELKINYPRFSEKFNHEKVREDLAEIDVTEFNLLNALFLDEIALREYTSNGFIHTDNNPVLEFPDLETDYALSFQDNLRAVFDRKVDPLPYITGFDNEVELAIFIANFGYEQREVAGNLIAGHKALIGGDPQTAFEYYEEAIENAAYLDTVDI